MCRVDLHLHSLYSGAGHLRARRLREELPEPAALYRAARARGIPLVLSVDAHSTGALGYLRFAVATARRGWARRGEVLNARPAEEFANAVRPSG